MKKILICPGERSGLAFLAQSTPLVTLPLLGESLIWYWLQHLAESRVKEALILATDRPEQVNELVGDGSRWGIKIQLISELQELSAEQALAKYGTNSCPLSGDDVIVLDHLPGLRDCPLFLSYGKWFAAIQEWLPHAAAMHRIGIHEVQPGLWVGRRTKIAASADLRPPCWIGANVRIGPDTIIGPAAVLEDTVMVESAAEVVSSIVGTATLVGTLTKVQDSLAWGNTLINWRSGSCTQVADAFLLCPLAPGFAAPRLKDSLHNLPMARRILDSVKARFWTQY